jgi:branched-chain amino acid transport system permease protein
MAGTLYPPVVGFVSPNAFPLDLSILFFFAIIVGGRGHVLGAVLGVVLLYVVPNILLAQFAQYRLFAYGAIALIIMLLMPKGIIGTLVHWRKRARPDLGSAISSAVSELVKSVPKGEVASPVDDRSPVAVQVSGLCKTFGRVVALDDVSLTVARGEIHGLVGANGSGKSTLLNILSGFYAIDTGSVSIKDRRVENLSVRSIAQAGVGRTFQTPRIFTDLTLWENLQAGIDANPPGNEPPFADQALKRLRDLLGDERVDNVAHGQRRLLEVVRVILTGADILLLDEPAAGLSEEERASFSHLLVRLRDDLGKTIILVEHDLRLVWGIADQITVLDTGKVIASGTPAQLLSDPVASKLFLGAADA